MGRLGIRIANAVLFGICCFEVAGVFNDVGAELLTPQPTSLDRGVAAQAAPTAAREWGDRQPILDRNLFGAQLFTTAVVVAPEPTPEEDLEATKLPLRLLGTLLSAVAQHSKAAITERGRPDHELLQEGDLLERHPQVQVAKIERGRVILDNRGRREELLLDEGASAAPPIKTAKRSSRRRSRRASSRPAAPAPITDQLRELQLERTGGRNARDLFNQAKVIPKFNGDEMLGMEVRDIEPGSLYESVGLKDGDIIQSFNGIKLDSAAAGAKVLTQFVEADEFEIELSDGTIKSISADELTELLE